MPAATALPDNLVMSHSQVIRKKTKVPDLNRNERRRQRDWTAWKRNPETPYRCPVCNLAAVGGVLADEEVHLCLHSMKGRGLA
jgi:hypothetical protein